MQDLAKLFVWVLRHYEEIDPIILSGQPLTPHHTIHTHTPTHHTHTTHTHTHNTHITHTQWGKRMRYPSKMLLS